MLTYSALNHVRINFQWLLNKIRVKRTSMQTKMLAQLVNLKRELDFQTMQLTFLCKTKTISLVKLQKQNNYTKEIGFLTKCLSKVLYCKFFAFKIPVFSKTAHFLKYNFFFSSRSHKVDGKFAMKNQIHWFKKSTRFKSEYTQVIS